MSPRVRSFFARHPVIRDAIIWAIPAMLAGSVIRLLLLNYLPYAYWGSDSNSYYSFAQKLLSEAYISLGAKRRFLYPILMVPVSLLPGAPLQWLAWLQHGLGVVSLVPLAYVVRKTLVHWRFWIVPVTVIYAGLPMIVWYEHELLGETIFFATLLWAFAGWVAWVSEPRLDRSRRLFWWFFVPLALFLLTKPSGRFVWPGVALGLLGVLAWRRLDRRRWLALAALVLVTLAVGSKKQGAWLLYVASFPLTQLETPLHAEYKREIRKEVEAFRREIDTYYLHDDWPFAFLESPGRQDERPAWKALGKDENKRAATYMDLALEGIKARPDLFLYLGLQRLAGSVNPSEFKEARFTGAYYIEKFEHHYEEAQTHENSPLRMAFGLPKRGPLPRWEEFQHRISPAPDSWPARAVLSWVRGYERVSNLVRLPDGRPSRERTLAAMRLTPLGWWMVAAILLSLLPRYRSTLGVWTVIVLGYAIGVFLVSQINPRYFCPAWPVLVVLLAVPADLLVTVVARLRRQATTLI